MEIPTELKSLYSHWSKHTLATLGSFPEVKIDEVLLRDVISFATERMRAWENKVNNQPAPYSANPILQKYRFCNIYRELDRQTMEIHRDLLPLKYDFNLWLLNLAFQRFVCKPETVKHVGHLRFDEGENKLVLERLLELERPKYGTAYVFPISAIQRSNYPTREEFFCLYLSQIIPAIAEIIQSFDNTSVQAALIHILPIFGFNFKFHWTEILIDVAYQFPEYIDLNRDFHIGPGALPTLKSLSGDQDLNAVLNKLATMQLASFPYLTFEGKAVLLSAENWEGIGCEYRKYTNLLKGAGRRRKF